MIDPELDRQRSLLLKSLQERGITDPQVLKAIEEVPRERFLPEDLRERAYEDNALPIAHRQTISQPYIVGLMTQALQLTGHELILEIGTGSGYQTAILSGLCLKIVTIERIAELMEQARAVLDALGVSNVEYHVGDGTLGWPVEAPYDGILVAATAPKIPKPLYDQLKPGGRMIIPIGNDSGQNLLSIEKQDQPVISELCGCRFVPLIGEAAWAEDPEA